MTECQTGEGENSVKNDCCDRATAQLKYKKSELCKVRQTAETEIIRKE